MVGFQPESRRMKFLLYANLSGDGGAGGVQTYLAALIKALGQLDDCDERYVILAPDTNADWIESVLGPNQELLRLKYTPPGLGRRTLSKLAQIVRRIDDAAAHTSLFRRAALSYMLSSVTVPPDPEPALSNGYFESLGANCIHFPFQQFIVTSLPSVFNPHDLQHVHLPSFFTPATLVHRERTYSFACRHATRVAVTSEWVADDLVTHYGLPRNRIVIVPWGAATATLTAPTVADILAVKEKYACGESFIFYPAVAWPHKNHGCLLEAIALLRRRGHSLRVILTGGPTSMHSVLHEKCRALGLTTRVTIAGLVPSTELRALYRAALAVAVPTLFEAASGPVAEAWFEGTPVACSDIPALRVQAASAARFFDPYSPESIADAVADVAFDQNLRIRLIAAGRERIARFTWRETAIGYRAIYRDIAACAFSK